MDPSAIQAIIGVIPGGGIAALALFALYKKDAQCTALAEKLTAIAAASAVSNAQVVSALDALRDAIKQGTGA